MRTNPERHRAQVALAALVAAGALLVLGTGVASAAPAASASPTSGCWLDVINDWLQNSRVDRTYAIPCYTQAIQRLNSYPDVQNYSNAADDIHRALLAAIRQDRGSGPGSGAVIPSGPDGGSGPGSGPGAGSGTGKTHDGVFRRIANRLAPSSAQSIPLPLLVLGGLALLLLAAAGATWLARRVQAKRVPPAAPKRP